jgi:sulfur relay (sulfurtransferase) complex TusBCD TusD component (DsrE family)
MEVPECSITIVIFGPDQGQTLRSSLNFSVCLYKQGGLAEDIFLLNYLLGQKIQISSSKILMIHNDR